MNKSLFAIKTSSGRLLYRSEDAGYCFYSTKQMKFFFLDKITGEFLLEYFGEIDKYMMQSRLEEVLGYSVADSYDEVKTHYLKSIPKELVML